MDKMVNLSNHPSSKWGKAQMDAAKELCPDGVQDLPFPMIDPKLTDQEVYLLAQEYVDKAREIGEVVHVMGESGFVAAFVSIARISAPKADPLYCIYSTTERIVVENVQTGEKMSTFRFVQFRKYVTYQDLYW